MSTFHMTFFFFSSRRRHTISVSGIPAEPLFRSRLLRLKRFSTFSVKVLNLFSRSRRKTNKRKSKHSVPRFFVPEHGTMFTLALVRFPPTATKEIQYLNAKGALTYTDIAGDPVLYGNLPPREISMKDVFRSGDSSKKFKIAEGQWYRYAPSYVSPAYHLLEGFPFIQEPPSGDLQ